LQGLRPGPASRPVTPQLTRDQPPDMTLPIPSLLACLAGLLLILTPWAQGCEVDQLTDLEAKVNGCVNRIYLDIVEEEGTCPSILITNLVEECGQLWHSCYSDTEVAQLKHSQVETLKDELGHLLDSENCQTMEEIAEEEIVEEPTDLEDILEDPLVEADEENIDSDADIDDVIVKDLETEEGNDDVLVKDLEPESENDDVLVDDLEIENENDVFEDIEDEKEEEESYDVPTETVMEDQENTSGIDDCGDNEICDVEPPVKNDNMLGIVGRLFQWL